MTAPRDASAVEWLLDRTFGHARLDDGSLRKFCPACHGRGYELEDGDDIGGVAFYPSRRRKCAAPGCDGGVVKVLVPPQPVPDHLKKDLPEGDWNP